MKIKGLMSIILSITIILSTVVVGFFAYADEIDAKNIESFVDELTDIISTYDTDKEFVVSSETPEIISQNDDPTIWEPILFEDDEKTLEENELKFQTCRLIVEQSKKFDDKDAIAVADGFEDYHIVQFENEKDTEEAYNEYLNDKNVSSVSVDEAFIIDTLNENNTSNIITSEDLTDNWYTYSTGIGEFFDRNADFLSDSSLPEIKVAVFDTGINPEHDYFANVNKDRLVSTGFNLFSENEDETDDTNGHGTMVSSVIAANTPDCVKIASYKVIGNNGVSNLSYLIAAFAQALKDECKIVNCSFILTGINIDNNKILQNAMKKLYEADIFICVGAGNDATNMDRNISSWYFEHSDYVFCVGGSSAYNVPYQMTNYGNAVKLLAPATDIPVAEFKGGYRTATGTSFSTPFISSVYTLLCIFYPKISMTEKERMMVGSTVQHETPYSTGYFGSGIIDVLKLFDMVDENAPEINIINSGENYGTDKCVYVGPVTVELKADENCDVYYTMGSKYPSPKDGILYTEPIEFSDDYFTIKAVAVNKKTGHRSAFSLKQIHSATLGTDEMFSVDSNGVITEYKGDIQYLKIPEKINGVEVIDIAPYVFSKASFLGVVFPDTIEKLGIYGGEAEIDIEDGFYHYCSYAFKNNKTVQYITARNLMEVHDNAFEGTTALREVDFPKVELLCSWSFAGTFLWGAYLPNLKTLTESVFSSNGNPRCFMREFFAPNLSDISYFTFQKCRYLTRLEIPNASNTKNDGINEYLNDVINSAFYDTEYLNKLVLNRMKTISSSNSDTFRMCGAKRMEFSSIENLDSFPGNYIVSFRNREPIYLIRDEIQNVVLVLPSTLKNAADPYYFKGNQERLDDNTIFTIYATESNSYVNEWAKQYGFDIISLNEQTAIAEDVYSVYDRFSNDQLSFDCYGFNKQYQWYGSYTNDTENGIPLDDANSEVFSPEDYEYYPYYYCVMTSTDKDSDGNVVKSFDAYSTVSHNLLYSEPEEPTTEPTKPTEPSTEVTEPQTEDTTVSTTVHSTKPTVTANETASEVSTTDNQTSHKQSQNKSTSSQNIKKNNSKISPSTGVENDSIVIFCSCIIVLLEVILIKRMKRKPD